MFRDFVLTFFFIYGFYYGAFVWILKSRLQKDSPTEVINYLISELLSKLATSGIFATHIHRKIQFKDFPEKFCVKIIRETHHGKFKRSKWGIFPSDWKWVQHVCMDQLNMQSNCTVFDETRRMHCNIRSWHDVKIYIREEIKTIKWEKKRNCKWMLLQRLNIGSFVPPSFSSLCYYFSSSIFIPLQRIALFFIFVSIHFASTLLLFYMCNQFSYILNYNWGLMLKYIGWIFHADNWLN